MLKNIKRLYFIGVGGIGMSALARYAKLQGYQVAGYDKTPSDLTDVLKEEGILITFVDAATEIQADFQKRQETLVVYTPAIPKNNHIFNWFKDRDFKVVKRSQLLGEVTRNTLCLAVAGTHGKTTTSAILGHVLASCGMPVTAFLGGIAENYQSNFISRGTEITVVEADEFDRSFLTLNPNIACVTSMDADHLDIYGDAQAIEAGFRAFAELLPKKENLLFKRGLPLSGKTVAVGAAADYRADNVRIENGAYVFDLITPSLTVADLRFYLPGHHNLHNAVTALGMAILAGSPTDCLPKALATFKGVDRRFSYRIRTPEIILIDDYAHHPTEINALYQAVSEMYPDDQYAIVFQPHLFSRTQDFAEGFAKSLAQFDDIFLLDIYPAREEPIEGVTSTWLKGMIEAVKTTGALPEVVTKAELGTVLMKSSARVKLMVGAGDIGAEVKKVTKVLSS